MSAFTVLVVDDDPEVRELLRQHLALAGFRVALAEDGAAGLERARGERPDLVLLDVQMPVMDGFETLARLRGHAELRDVPVLLLTSLASRHLKVRGLEAGAEDYLTKPFDRAELLARVRAGLRRAARYRVADRALSGDVGEVGLDTLLQTFQLSGKAGRIRLPEAGAELWVRGGELACAWRDRTGADALARLLLLARGSFFVETGGVPEALAEAAPIGTVMMGAAVALDEMRQVLAEAALEERAWLEVANRPCADGAIEALRAAFPLRVAELVAALPGPLDDAATAVWTALIAGELRASARDEI
ncbi:MAG: response regulator [Myxococcales bacterium]|nr:response regulator [Myxococcales bacterium]